jgi:zinc protease
MRLLILTLTVLLASEAHARKPEPKESPLDRYVADANARTESAAAPTPGAIWSPGARLADAARDVRASQVDDILTVLVVENHRVPVVTMDLVLPASTLSDPPQKRGVAEAIAEMMKQGTATRSSRQIADELSEMGASLSVYAGWGAKGTRLGASALTENLDSLLALTSDVLLNATFPEDEFAKWKKRKLTSFQQQRANPAFLGSERFAQVLYAGDARSNISGTAAAVNRMTRQDLLDFRKQFYVPGGSILGVTGDTTPDAIVAKLEKAFGGWQAGTAISPELAPKSPIAEKKIYLVNRPGSVQTFLMLGNHAVDRLSPDYIACMVLNRILGSGPSSRLFINIREEHGFTYGVYSRFQADKYLDAFSASSSVRTEVTGAALDEFLKEFRKIRDEAVPKEELENAKRAIVANFALSIERQAGVLSQVMQLREFGLPADYWDTYAEKVMAVSADDVQRAARKYVPFDNLQVVAVGDGSKIADVLKKYGPVEQYNSEGLKID